MDNCVYWYLICICFAFECYGDVRDKIPNGHGIPHPCGPNFIWQGNGHPDTEIGGMENGFVQDFKEGGFKWTVELCQLDSDRDGLTNGEELGDPDCSWRVGNPHPSKPNISHPGVCEPWNQASCQHQHEWLTKFCEENEFNCEAINDPDVQKMTLKFPPTKVPENENSYVYMEFDLDTSDSYHLIATQLLVDNQHVIHHVMLYGCFNVASNECAEILDILTPERIGSCFHQDMGFLIGSQGFRRVAVQLHWKNTSHQSDIIDGPGVILYYTKNKRPNDAGLLMIGADYLEISAGRPTVIQTGTCHSRCTKQYINDRVYVVRVFNAMHHLGVSQKIELYRNGSKIVDLAIDMDNLHVYRLKKPIEVLPGDTILTTCIYSLHNRDSYAKSDMCYGFLTYYPKSNMNATFCTSWKSLPGCEIYEGGPYQNCDLVKFNSKHGIAYKLAARIEAACYYMTCSHECQTLISQLLSHPCMQNDFQDYFRQAWYNTAQGQVFLEMLDNCPLEDITTQRQPRSVQTYADPRPEINVIIITNDMPTNCGHLHSILISAIILYFYPIF